MVSLLKELHLDARCRYYKHLAPTERKQHSPFPIGRDIRKYSQSASRFALNAGEGARVPSNRLCVFVPLW